MKVDWGTGLGGLRLQWATTVMLSLRHEQKYFVNWRPRPGLWPPRTLHEGEGGGGLLCEAPTSYSRWCIVWDSDVGRWGGDVSWELGMFNKLKTRPPKHTVLHNI